jgi:sec-independent protein translocase protein TatC
MAKKNLGEMSFLDHLEELRWLLVRSTIATMIMAFVTYFISDYLFDEIILGPTRPTFFTYVWFCDLSHQLGFADSICITQLNFIIQNTEMEGQVNIFVWMCLLAGFILSFPYILWEIWKFISPAYQPCFI